jgi:hypothetical protein
MVSVGRTAAGSTTCQTELDWGGDRCPPVTGGYRVVVPLPSWTDALPHLAAPPGVRRTLAGAFARDTLDAVRKVGRVHDVLVATADPLVAEEASAWGAGILDCSGIQASCIREAAREAFLRAGLQGATAVLEGTLPCLLPAELDQAIRTARREPVEVLDLAGIRPTPGAGRPTSRIRREGPRCVPRGWRLRSCSPGCPATWPPWTDCVSRPSSESDRRPLTRSWSLATLASGPARRLDTRRTFPAATSHCRGRNLLSAHRMPRGRTP